MDGGRCPPAGLGKVGGPTFFCGQGNRSHQTREMEVCVEVSSRPRRDDDLYRLVAQVVGRPHDAHAAGAKQQQRQHTAQGERRRFEGALRLVEARGRVQVDHVEEALIHALH